MAHPAEPHNPAGDLGAGDDGDEPLNGPGAAPRRRLVVRRGPAEDLPLHNLLRLLAGAGARDPVDAGSHEGLITSLKRSGMLTSEAVTRAMVLVPRGSFVPEAHRAEAWVDSPIRVEADDFNISAPHMHAQMLESLDIQPGDRVLDVGCGCGFLAACAALLVGRAGTVVGVDIKAACMQLSGDNISRLRASNNSYASAAAPVSLLRHNVFMPSPKLKGCFNKVCVGATCPEDRLHLLLPLLEPGGGRLLAPVDNDLRLYTRGADGSIRQRVVSSVRFSDLEVPCDAAIALSVLRDEQCALMEVQVSRPSLAEDLGSEGVACGATAGRASTGAGTGCMHMWSSCFSSFSSLESGCVPHSLGASLGSSSSGSSLPAPDTPMLAACKAGAAGLGCGSQSQCRGGPAAAAAAAVTEAPAGPDESLMARRSSSGGSRAAASDDDTCLSCGGDVLDDAHMVEDESQPRPSASAAFGGAEHGEPDCALIGGQGWSLWAHKHVLKSRAAHFRARLSSGMRDAHDCQHKVPEGFSQSCIEALLCYCYSDDLPTGLEPPAVVELLQAASYYGTPRLIELCEARLVHELLQLSPSAAAGEAPHLLALADELGLAQLRRAAVAFIASRFNDVQASEAWQQLDRSQVELVASQLSDELNRLKQLLVDLQPPAGAAAPKRRGWW